MLVHGVNVHLQSGIRNGTPVVVCTLNYGAHNPLHFLQVDKPMPSLAVADAYVCNANLFVCRSILSRLTRSEGVIIASVNKVFGASESEASMAYAKLRSNSKWKK